MKRALLVLAALLAVAGAATWWALESSDVAVIQTVAPDGSLRSTHVWYVEPDAALWLEAGTPDNPWLLDVRRQPTLAFTAAGRTRRHRVRIVDGAAAHDRIRALMREKYGARDRWVGLLVDTSHSVAVELVPEPE